jgi:hypothetical protein
MTIGKSLRETENSFTEVALNPQPLPPKAVGGLFANPLDKVALNPQPLPPKSSVALFASLLQKLGLISQPQAPLTSPALFSGVLQKTALNPQPLPPKAVGGLFPLAQLPNGGLMANPTGNNPLGGLVRYNPHYYATQQAALEAAKQVGGKVVDLPGHVSNNQSQYFIELPNGITINAGNLLAILNNPVYQENSRVMDGKIAELLNNDAVGTPGAGAGRYTVRDGHVSYSPEA